MQPSIDNSPVVDAVSLRVLVIDDHRTMRQIIRDLLGQVGIKSVEEAASGEEALAFLRRPRAEHPDVIICDLHMDNIDGIEFCNIARRSKTIQDRGIPILILTGERDDFVHEVAQQVGAAAVLTKPISARDLLQQIRIAVGFSVGADCSPEGEERPSRSGGGTTPLRPATGTCVSG